MRKYQTDLDDFEEDDSRPPIVDFTTRILDGIFGLAGAAATAYVGLLIYQLIKAGWWFW